MAKRSTKPPSPLPVAHDLLWAGWREFAVVAGTDLDFFTAIAGGKTTAAEVAAAADADEGAMRRLLDALVALRYLTRKDEKYRVTPVSAAYLVRGSELYMDGAVPSRAAISCFGRDWPELCAPAARSGWICRRSNLSGLFRPW